VFAIPNPDYIVDPTPNAGTQVAQAHQGIFAHRPDAAVPLGGFATTLATTRACSFKAEGTC
jgi:hypothetical protein